jgi:hypothetical protein
VWVILVGMEQYYRWLLQHRLGGDVHDIDSAGQTPLVLSLRFLVLLFGANWKLDAGLLSRRIDQHTGKL